MEEVFDVVPPSDDLFEPRMLFPDNEELQAGYDLLTDETGSALEQSCVSSSPASPHCSGDTPIAMLNNDFTSHNVQASSPVIKDEPIDSSVYEPPLKRECISESSSEERSPALFPNVVDLSNPASVLSSLAKGRSEDIELFRNSLKCQGILTTDLEKKLKHLSRQVKNRESAQTSRKRKREYVEQLRSAILKMHTVEDSLRTSLSTAQIEIAQKKAEAEKWQEYAHDLENILKLHGIVAPEEPVIPVGMDIPVKLEPVEDVFPEALFEGPCGFGHMSAPKGCSHKRRGPRAEKRQKQ